MRILKFAVNQQNIKKDGDFSGLVPGTKGYLFAEFHFSSDWSGCRIAASFFSNNGEYPVQVTGNRCEIPEEVLKGSRFLVQLTGIKNGFKIKTNKLLIRQEG